MLDPTLPIWRSLGNGHNLLVDLAIGCVALAVIRGIRARLAHRAREKGDGRSYRICLINEINGQRNFINSRLQPRLRYTNMHENNSLLRRTQRECRPGLALDAARIHLGHGPRTEFPSRELAGRLR